MLVGNRIRKKNKKKTQLTRCAVISKINDIYDLCVSRPPESSCLAYDFRPQQTKVFSLVSWIWLGLLLLWTSTWFSLRSNESENVEQVKWSLESEKSALFTILTEKNTADEKKVAERKRTFCLTRRRVNNESLMDFLSFFCWFFVEQIHRSSHLEMVYISFAHVANIFHVYNFSL